MVTDEFAEEDFVLGDLLAQCQLELALSGRAKRFAIALSFAGRIRSSDRHNRAIGLGVIRATRCR